MFVCPTVSELHFYGCCHPCLHQVVVAQLMKILSLFCRMQFANVCKVDNSQAKDINSKTEMVVYALRNYFFLCFSLFC